MIVEKCRGSIAKTGADLASCKALGDKINAQTARIVIAFIGCTVPFTGKPPFKISDTEIEVGGGINGEPRRMRENAAKKLLKEQAITIARSLVGNYTIAIDMVGASINVCVINDEIKQHWDSPVHTAVLRRGV